MGVRLIVEILDHWQDAGLTAGERDDLIILAENANDSTRQTWGGVHEPYILKRAGKTAASWKNSVGKLTRKGVLVQHTGGRAGQVAVYRLVGLCPEGPHDGWHGHCTRPERVTSQMTQPDAPSGEGHPTSDPDGGEGHLTGVERVTPQVPPTPLPPSTNPPPSPAPPSPPPPAAPAAEGREGGEAPPERHSAYETLLRITATDPRLTIGDREARTLLPLVAPWLERATEDQLRQALTAGLPAQIDSPVGILRRRLLDKLPPPRFAPVVSTGGGLPAWCGQCGDGMPAAQYNPRFRRNDGQPCPDCHPDRHAA